MTEDIMNITEDFVTQFHNLEGVTVAEKKRNFFHFLHKNSSLSENTILLDSITSQLVAETHLEKIFLVDFLIYFRRHRELLQEFLKGDDIIISKVAKQNWFFHQVFGETGPDFVHQVLPTLSVSTRLKILKKLALILDEKQCDAIFDALLNRYGVFVATNVLTGCSSDKIEQVLKDFPIQLWTAQLKLLYKKNPQLIHIYFEDRGKKEVPFFYQSFFKFIATQDPVMFCILQEKYKQEYCRVGKRATKKLVRSSKDRIMAHPELYVNNVNKAKFVRTLGSDFKQVFFKLFPTQIDMVLWGNRDLLKYYPKNGRFALFRNTFDQVFYCKLDSTEDFFRGTIFQGTIFDMITNSEEREKWAKIEYQKEQKTWLLKYFQTKSCFNMIKEKLNVSSQVAQRVENIAVMTECCLINEDWNELLTVCEVLCNRFKNDDKGLHSKFLEIITMQQYKSIFDNFNENHWEYIKKIISMPGIKVRNHGDKISLIFRYFEFLHNIGKFPSDDEFINLLKNSKWLNALNNLQQTNPKSMKMVVIKLINLAPQLLDSEQGTIDMIDCHLIVTCKTYKIFTPQEILQHPRLVESIKKALNNPTFPEKQLISLVTEWIICTGNRNEVIEDLTILYWQNFKHYALVSIVKWFLRHRPEIVINNIVNFLSGTFENKISNPNYYYYRGKNMITFWKTIKCYTHLEFDQKVIDFCTQKLKDEDFSQAHLFQPLSILMKPEDFAKLTEDYVPASPTVDLLDEKCSQLFQMQRHLLKSFINVKTPELMLSILFRFCSGDYVASSISPLYSCLYRVPENRIGPFLEKLCATGAVSVKKHGFFFICIVSDEKTILNALKSCHLSQAIAMSYQHLVKNPSDEAWNIFQNKLTKLDKNDHFTTLLLVNTPAPKKYKSRCFLATFEVFRKLNSRFTKVLLDKIEKKTVQELPLRFFSVIKDDFPEMNKSDLIFSYLFCCEDKEKFRVIFDALQAFKQKQWSFRANEPRKKLTKFITTLFTAYLECEDTNVGLVDEFMEGFKTIFQPVEAFEEYIIISAMRFKNQNTIELSKSVLELNRHLVERFGKLTIKIFAECLKNVLLPTFYKKESDIFEFYNTLLNLNESIDDVLLVIELLPQNAPVLKQSGEYYHNMLKVLKQIESESVRVHLSLLLNEV